MYDLPYHKEVDEKVIRDFVAQYPFAFLTGCDLQGHPVATQIPVLLDQQDERIVLRGHIMRHTDHHQAFAQNPHVLVVFSGPHAYVSGSWYSEPHTPSTWNYMSVHARGTIRFLDGPDLDALLRHTSLHFEEGNLDSPTAYDNLPAALKDRVLKAIVAFEIEVTEMANVFKLSQDRDHESYLNIIKELRTRGEAGHTISQEMQKRIPQLFPEESSRGALNQTASGASRPPRS